MFVIETQCYEDYGYRIKAKGGRSILVETGYRPDAEAVARLIEDEFEHIIDIREEDANYESWLVKSQKEMNDLVVYLDPVVRRGRSGDFYLKRGYLVNEDERREEFKHLAGQFVGWVDNLNTGKCVCKIEGDKRTPLNG
jgi:hypothetical protein